MKTILLILATFIISLGSCSRNSGEAQVQDDEPTGAFGAAAPADSVNVLNQPDSVRNDGYKADSITQTYPIPR